LRIQSPTRTSNFSTLVLQKNPQGILSQGGQVSYAPDIHPGSMTLTPAQFDLPKKTNNPSSMPYFCITKHTLKLEQLNHERTLFFSYRKRIVLSNIHTFYWTKLDYDQHANYQFQKKEYKTKKVIYSLNPTQLVYKQSNLTWKAKSDF